MTEFLGHFHTFVTLAVAVIVAIFLVYRHLAELLPWRRKQESLTATQKRDRALAAHEFLLVAILFVVLSMAAKTENMSSAQEGIESRLNSIDDRITQVATSLPPAHEFEVLQDYDSFVHSIEREVKRTQGRWLITRIQLQQATTRQEDAYFKTMITRVQNEEIRDCRRIVRIDSRDHLDRYLALVRQLGDKPYFGLAIWKPDTPPFNFEMLIGDDVVILAYGVGAPAWGIRVPDKATADHFATTFDYMWNSSESTEVVKGLRSLSEQGIQNASRRLSDLFQRQLDAHGASTSKSPLRP